MSSNNFFEGFEPPHSGEEGDGLIIPRSFFERVVITEPASTIRVVAFILLRTLEGQSEVEASYTDFVRELRLCRQSVQEGLARAMEAGYIRLLQSGENGHVKSRYAICWATSSSSPPPPSSPPPDKGGSSNNHHTTRSTTNPSSPPTSTLPVRKNQNATKQTANHQSANQPTEKQTGNISRTLRPAVVDSISNKTSTSLSNKVSMRNRRVELVESGVPARKADQPYFYPTTFPTTTTATLPSSNIISSPASSSYYCHDSLAATTFPICTTPSSATSTATSTPAKPPLAVSSYLSHLSSDISREFRDISHARSNRTQTHNLWHHSHLPEAEFARLMYQARELTRRHAVLRVGEVPPPPGQGRNRMPYFFACLRDLLGLRGEEGKSSNPRRNRNRSSSLNDQTAKVNQSRASAATLYKEACRQKEEEERQAQQEEQQQQFASSAYPSKSKLNYTRGSQWREAQAFKAGAETDNTIPGLRSGYALVDSSLPTASDAATAARLLAFPLRTRSPRATRPSDGTSMAAHSPGFNHSNSYWNYQTEEEEEGNTEEDEVRWFTTDHTTLEIAPNFKHLNASNPAGNRAIPEQPLFGGAEARSRERYLAKYGPRGFPTSERVYQAEEATTSTNLTT